MLIVLCACLTLTLFYSCRSGVLNQLRGQPLAACLSYDNDEDLITVISSEENAICRRFSFPSRNLLYRRFPTYDLSIYDKPTLRIVIAQYIDIRYRVSDIRYSTFFSAPNLLSCAYIQSIFSPKLLFVRVQSHCHHRLECKKCDNFTAICEPIV
jgi:hypothetical protein